MGVEDGTETSPVLFSLASGRLLLEQIAEHLQVPMGRWEEREFEDGEHKIRPLESVRGRDVYVVQSLYEDLQTTVNDKLIRLLFFLGALRDAGARRLTAVVPYLCYSRKDMRTKPRDPVSTRYVASLFESMGIDRMVTVDVHNRAAFQNAFRVPTVHLTAAPLFAGAFADHLVGRRAVVVSPDAGGAKRAEQFRQALQDTIDRPVGSAFVEKYRSEGVVRGGRLVGEVEGRVAIIFDDLVSSGTTLARAADSCLEQGAQAVWAAATHGVFSKDSARVLGTSRLERLFVLDTIPVEGDPVSGPGTTVKVMDCAPLVAQVIDAMHSDRSVVELTRP